MATFPTSELVTSPATGFWPDKGCIPLYESSYYEAYHPTGATASSRTLLIKKESSLAAVEPRVGISEKPRYVGAVDGLLRFVNERAAWMGKYKWIYIPSAHQLVKIVNIGGYLDTSGESFKIEVDQAVALSATALDIRVVGTWPGKVVLDSVGTGDVVIGTSGTLPPGASIDHSIENQGLPMLYDVSANAGAELLIRAHQAY